MITKRAWNFIRYGSSFHYIFISFLKWIMKYSQVHFMYHMLLLYLFSLRKKGLSTTCAKYILTIPRFSYLASTFSCLPDLYIRQRTWCVHVIYNSHLQVHMSQMELLIYATFIPILFTVFLILVNDSIILPVAQARNLGVILVFLPFPHTQVSECAWNLSTSYHLTLPLW